MRAGGSGTHQQRARARAAHLPGALARALVRHLEPPPPSKRELKEDVVGRRVTSVAGGHAGHTSAGGGQQGRRSVAGVITLHSAQQLRPSVRRRSPAPS